jgi:hypothetical protein
MSAHPLTAERFGPLPLLELEADGRRWVDADHSRPGLDHGATVRRRDRLRAAVVAAEARP